MSNLNGEFLAKFQELEKIIKESSSKPDNAPFRDALYMASLNNDYLQQHKGLVEDLYALRNVFAHRQRGKYVASINKFAINELSKLIDNLKNPPTAISKFKTKVFQAELNDLYFDISDAMATFTYTHVPVWRTKRGNRYGGFVGVLSYTTVFEWFVNHYINYPNGDFSQFDEPGIIGEINKKYLNSPVVNYKFVEEKKNIYEIPPLWDKHTKQRKRLDCLLITKNGKKGEQITGIITSWDLGAI
jgi:hypothetical protein